MVENMELTSIVHFKENFEKSKSAMAPLGDLTDSTYAELLVFIFSFIKKIRRLTDCALMPRIWFLRCSISCNRIISEVETDL